MAFYRSPEMAESCMFEHLCGQTSPLPAWRGEGQRIALSFEPFNLEERLQQKQNLGS